MISFNDAILVGKHVFAACLFSQPSMTGGPGNLSSLAHGGMHRWTNTHGSVHALCMCTLSLTDGVRLSVRKLKSELKEKRHCSWDPTGQRLRLAKRRCKKE